MGVMTVYSFSANIHLKCHMVCLSVILSCYRMTRLRYCNEKGALFVPDPVFGNVVKRGALTRMMKAISE